jgi:hypothetical protein
VLKILILIDILEEMLGVDLPVFVRTVQNKSKIKSQRISKNTQPLSFYSLNLNT